MQDESKTIPQHFLDAMGNSAITPEERIKRIYQYPGWTNSIDDRLAYKPFVMLTDAEDSLDLLVEWYVNKKSKRVKYAGSKLRRAFLTLPPVEQRKVGLALLTGGKTDTEWVCARLLNYKPAWNKEWDINWHPCYAGAVEQAWLKHKGKQCGKLLIYFLDSNIVRQHMNDLAEDDELYICLCQRFVDEPWFQVDADRLASCTYINEYLSIMSQTPQGISDEEAETLLYQWIGTIAALFIERSSWMHQYSQNFWRSNVEEHRVIYSWGMDTALYYLLNMNKNRVVNEFLKWDQKVYLAYYSRLSTEHDSPDNRKLFVECIIDNFPEEYSRFTRLNTQHFHFAKSPGQPLVRPPKIPWDFLGELPWPYFGPIPIKEKIEEGYLPKNEEPVSTTEVPSIVETKEATHEELLRMVSDNPNLRKLVETFGLTTTNTLANGNIVTEKSCPF